MTGRLTDEQRKLVEDNHELIFDFMKTMNLNENDTIDWYGELAVCMCEAALNFVPSGNSGFVAYVFILMSNKMINLLSSNEDGYMSLEQYYEEYECDDSDTMYNIW